MSANARDGDEVGILSHWSQELTIPSVIELFRLIVEEDGEGIFGVLQAEPESGLGVGLSWRGEVGERL